jgi:hypothetical protein
MDVSICSGKRYSKPIYSNDTNNVMMVTKKQEAIDKKSVVHTSISGGSGTSCVDWIIFDA